MYQTTNIDIGMLNASKLRRGPLPSPTPDEVELVWSLGVDALPRSKLVSSAVTLSLALVVRGKLLWIV
ncbi:MAG: hypothetical protein OQK94_08220 [Gammaproteobacteria bacterium]|nr:hypothetical protein [Gammaproteobacteria bacterium]MCW8840825.1 hypothetical protein [Gammaproteobacteria bacterium]MCW8958011.1 hypothetical protein [Gammaproteobacteria bacterium]MCW8972502.1 hypothetical protein [Gammaproteobacteria bacterium]MCW8992148.1 hypothetical protein [Gammaproteobacteria bacterium]